MLRVNPETELEKKMMCLGAVFVEENQILDELYQVIGSDLIEGEELAPDVKDQVLNEVSESFFRLDMNYGPDSRPDCIAILEDFWGVYGKDSALKALEDIRQQGHRTKFNVLRTTLPAEGRLNGAALQKFKQIFQFDFAESQQLQMSDDDYQKLAQWLQRTQNYLKEAGILAWDAARYVHLTRLSYIAGYLSDDEAWAQILKLAPLVEGHFSSWMEFAQSFLIGRTFWAGNEDVTVKGICERLLGHPASPWQFYGW